MAIQNTWKAIPKGDNWIVQTPNGQLIATIGKGKDTEANARLIAASPMMLEALSGLVQLIGEEDLPDNGELSGAAICDLARSALAVATGNENWPLT